MTFSDANYLLIKEWPLLITNIIDYKYYTLFNGRFFIGMKYLLPVDGKTKNLLAITMVLPITNKGDRGLGAVTWLVPLKSIIVFYLAIYRQ